MNFAVMPAAQGNRELITHPSSEGSALRKSEVVRIGRTPAANHAGMSCDEFHMLSIADSSRLRILSSILSIVEVSVLGSHFRSSGVAWLLFQSIPSLLNATQNYFPPLILSRVRVGSGRQPSN
jgi:hypothetical protein